jgi:hypothetical protein
MTRLHILCAVVFGSMLAIAGCGETNGGSAGSGGSGGSAGSGGGMATGSCQIICNADCELFGPDPASATCASDCMAENLDGCVPETTALVACADQAQGGDCNIDPTDSCQSEVDAFNACDSGSGGTAGAQCTRICNSECSGILEPGPACLQECATDGYDMEPCENEVNALYDCLEGANCDDTACMTEIDDWQNCG